MFHKAGRVIAKVPRSVSDPFSLNPDPAKNLNPDPSCFLTLPGININITILTFCGDLYLTFL